MPAGRCRSAPTAPTPRRASSRSTTRRVRADLAAGKVVIVTGFQGMDELGNITTLGRGGSDTSAVAVAAALKAQECLIYTDVDGVYTTDPRVVPEARRLKTVSFEEMLEMASLGSKVLQIRSVEFAGKYRVPLRVLSSFTPWDIPIEEEAVSGTLITFEEDEQMEQAIVSGIAFNRDEAKISVLGVPDTPGIAYQILGADRRRQHRRRRDHPERQQGRQDRLQLHRAPQRLRAGHRPAQGAGDRPAWARTKSSATPRSARSPSSASACAATSAWPAACSAC